MKLSMVVATNRNNFWHRFCESLSHNSVDLEVIFVGPVGPGNGKLPTPTRFIDIDAGAALCWEIGARAATGDLLGFGADDCVFTPGFLDDVAREAAGHHDQHDMFTGRYVHNGADQFPGQRFLSMPGMPTLPVGGFSYTRTHLAIGGIDRRFNAVLWDTEMYQDMYSRGGRVTCFDQHLCHEINDTSRLFVNNHEHDRAVIESLWMRKGKVSDQRLSPREPFTGQETGAGNRYGGVA